jgi:hypothetical protein
MNNASFKIAGIVYKILYKDDSEMQGRIGLANFNTQEIWINKSHTTQTKKIAILHEIVHLLDHAYNLNMSEDDVIYTTHGLLGLMLDNPDLLNNIQNLEE